MTSHQSTWDLVDLETERLLATAARLSDDDIAVESLCPGWSRGHILTHLARNADALGSVIQAAATGSDGTMYASDERRDADIEEGAGRPAWVQAADVRAASGALRAKAALLDGRLPRPEVERTPGGHAVTATAVPLLRLNEVVLHHADLLAGFTLADADPRAIDLLLTLARRNAPDDAPTVEATPAAELGYLARGLTDGVVRKGGSTA